MRKMSQPIFKILSWYIYDGTNKNHERCQKEQPVSQQRFILGISEMQRCAKPLHHNIKYVSPIF
jgi:hypothetical protein